MGNIVVSTGPDRPVATITGATAIVPTEFAAFFVDSTGGPFTVTLPPAASCVGLPVRIKAITSVSNLVTVACSGSDTIDGASSITLGSGGSYQGVVLISDDGTWRVVGSPGAGGSGSWPIAFSFAGSLVAVTGASKYPVPLAGTIVSAQAAVGTDPTGASVIVDVLKNGTTIYTTQANRPTIAAGTNESAAALPDVTAVAAGDLLSVNIAQVGSTTPGADLTVVVLVRPAS